MNAPIIWIIIPGLASIVLFILQDRVKIVNSVGILLALLLGLFAIALPIGQTITLGALSFEISDTLVVLGRRFVISKGDTALIALMYFGAAFWFGGVISLQFFFI